MNRLRLALSAAILLCLAACQSAPTSPWTADLGDGRYRNPVIHADYSDPDAIRVGERYYMTASSFNYVPGLPLLESPDMVNWQLVGAALPKLVPEERYATPQYGNGVWAPCLRYHDGKFWIFYPDPDIGVFVVTAERFEGPWSAPHLLLPGKGIIDPTPLWDDDGKAWLLHAWARSRAGVSNKLTLRSMAPDASRLLDSAGRDIIDGNRLPGYRTLEGPKFYKANGWYYVFAPAGGVEEGWQSVFRSRTIGGPYESRIVMAQGGTPINGPHQGAWVRAQDGSDWFLHFQDRKAYGRILHLQPMHWIDGWPVIGEPGATPGVGQPVLEHAKPVAGAFAVAAPPSGDEFAEAKLGVQWQWSANPAPNWYSLTARPGMLRLYTQAVPGAREWVRGASSILSQKVPAPAFTVDTHIVLEGANDGDRAGLIVNGMQYAWIGLRKLAGRTALISVSCTPFVMRCTEHATTLVADSPPSVYLRLSWHENAQAQFSYSFDGSRFVQAGAPFTAYPGRWVGATIGLFSVGDKAGSFADVDYFRVR